MTIRHIIPAQIRRELGIQGESTVIVEAENGRLVVRPAFVIPAEDAWAYTPEHIAKVRKAEAELDAGLGIRMTVDELRAYVGLPPADQDVDDDD